MFLIVNDGAKIAKTDFFDSDLAAQGLLYLSWSAGAARLLVPDNRHGWLNEMATAREVIISRGPWPAKHASDALELLFEDGTDSPFAVRIGVEQTDRLIPDQRIETGLDVLVITRAGVVLRLPAGYRRVTGLPCMAPWE